MGLQIVMARVMGLIIILVVEAVGAIMIEIMEETATVGLKEVDLTMVEEVTEEVPITVEVNEEAPVMEEVTEGGLAIVAMIAEEGQTTEGTVEAAAIVAGMEGVTALASIEMVATGQYFFIIYQIIMILRRF